MEKKIQGEGPLPSPFRRPYRAITLEWKAAVIRLSDTTSFLARLGDRESDRGLAQRLVDVSGYHHARADAAFSYHYQ